MKKWLALMRHRRELEMLKVVLLSLVILLSTNAYSLDKKKQAFVDGCVALVEIYETKNSRSGLAAVFTSVADSFQAGYCRGILEAFESGCRGSWHDMARFIAAQQPVIDQYRSLNALFKAACRK